MDIYKQRRENLRRLVRDWSGPANLANKLGYANASYIVQMAGPHPIRAISEKTARKIEGKLGLPQGWLDTDHKAEKPAAVREAQVVRIVHAVGAVLGDAGLTLPPAQFAEVVELVHEHAALTGEVSEPYISKLVELLRRK